MAVIRGLPALLFLVAACGGKALSPASVADVQSEIKAAEVVGAPEYPRAELYLKLAKDQLQDAKKLAEEGEEEEARMTLDRARADAELAFALAKEAQAQREARVAMEKIDQFRQQ